MRRFLIAIWLLSGPVCLAQRFPAEIGVVSDNDLYVSTVSDKYYTAGFEFFYRFITPASTADVKKIWDFRIGQYIFNPRTRKANDPAVIDRPFAGYLFAEAGKGYFRPNRVLKWNAQLGIVGPSSFAEETQKAIHFLGGYKKVRGWQHQIHDTFAAQLGLSYAASVLKPGKADLNFQGEVNAGTVLVNARVGLLSRFSLKGALLSLQESNLYGGALSSDPGFYKGRREFYFYISPNLKYVGYDATIQGSMFNDDSPVTYGVRPLLFSGEAGFKYRRNRWSVSYSFIYHNKEVKDSPANYGHYYGSVVISRFLE